MATRTNMTCFIIGLIGMFAALEVAASSTEQHTGQDQWHPITPIVWMSDVDDLAIDLGDGMVMYVNDWGIEIEPNSPLGYCIEAANAVCGAGNICCMRVTSTESGESCRFECRDGHGNCPDAGCGPRPDPNPDPGGVGSDD